MKYPDEFIEEMADLYLLKKVIYDKWRKTNVPFIKWVKNVHITFESFLAYKWGLSKRSV